MVYLLPAESKVFSIKFMISYTAQCGGPKLPNSKRKEINDLHAENMKNEF